MVNPLSSKPFQYNKIFIVALVTALVAAIYFSRSGHKEPDRCLEGDCLNGIGTLVMQDGKYTGQFVDGEFNGQGVLTVADGRKYEGEWLNDMPHGTGTQINPDGKETTVNM